MTRDNFIKQAVASGKSEDEIRSIFNSADNAGEFDDSPNKNIYDNTSETPQPTQPQPTQPQPGLLQRIGNGLLSSVQHPAQALQGVGIGMLQSLATNRTGEGMQTDAQRGYFPGISVPKPDFTQQINDLGQVIDNMATTPAQRAGKVVGNLIMPQTPLDVIPMAEGIKVAGMVAKAPFKAAAEAVEHFGENNSLLNIAQNLQAQRSGIPLTKAQAANVAQSTKMTGILANMEKVVSSIPGGQGVFGKAKQIQQGAAINSLKNITGDVLNSPFDYANEVSGNIQKNYDVSKDFFNKAYENIRAQGATQYIDGSPAANEALRVINSMSESKSLNPTLINKVQDYLGQLNDIKNKVTKTPSGYGENYNSFKDLLGNINSEIRQVSGSIYQGTSSIPPAELTRYAKVLGVIKGEMKNAEYAHLDAIGASDEMKEGLGTYLKNIDQKYGEEAGSLNIVKKIFGIGQDVDEKGFKDADQAVNIILNPNNKNKLNIALNYVDESGKQALGNALLTKIIKNSSQSTITDGVENLTNISMGKLENNLNKYRDQLGIILGKEKVSQFDDWMVGAKKARMQNINIANESNPSNTGFYGMIGSLLGAEGVAASLHNPAAAVTPAVLAGATSLGARQVAKFLTKPIANMVAK